MKKLLKYVLKIRLYLTNLETHGNVAYLDMN